MILMTLLSLAAAEPLPGKKPTAVILQETADRFNRKSADDRRAGIYALNGAVATEDTLTFKWEVQPADVAKVREELKSPKWANGMYCNQNFYRELVTIFNVTITHQIRAGSEIVADQVLGEYLCNRPPIEEPSATNALKLFDFKGIVAGGEVNRAYLRDCDKKERNWRNTCRALDGNIGSYNELAPYIDLYNNRLTNLTYLFNREAFNHIYASFIGKYGEPCKKNTIPWRNAAGAVLENQVVVWCFRTGELELRAISDNIRYGHAMYTDTYQAPATPAARNF